MRTSDIRVPHVEQSGRTITTLGGLAIIVATVAPHNTNKQRYRGLNIKSMNMDLYVDIGRQAQISSAGLPRTPTKWQRTLKVCFRPCAKREGPG
jgi:hypothetical protein